MMDRFLLDNAAKYESLVKALSLTPGPRIAKMTTGTTDPDMVISARIRPLMTEDVATGFPCAVFPRATHPGVVDIHDLYNHPKGRPILKVRKLSLTHISLSYWLDILITTTFSPSTTR